MASATANCHEFSYRNALKSCALLWKLSCRTFPFRCCTYTAANAGHAADPLSPPSCWRDKGNAPSGRPQERLLLSLYTLPPGACTWSCVLRSCLTRTQRCSSTAGARVSLSRRRADKRCRWWNEDGGERLISESYFRSHAYILRQETS